MLSVPSGRRFVYLFLAGVAVGVGAMALRGRQVHVVETPIAAGASVSAGESVPSTVTQDGRRRQLIGVRTARVARASVPIHVRASGIVRYDEAKITDVNLKFQGWIRDLSVNYVGQRVQKGQPLFTAYSPDLDALQNNLIGALRAREQTSAAQAADTPQYNDRLVESPRLRLKQWDVADEEVQQLEKTRQLPSAVIFRSPGGGVVIDKAILKGMHFEPGQTLYKIADVSTLVVEADFPEADAGRVASGTRAAIALAGLPGQRFSGRVVGVYPFLNEQTRALKVRIELPNTDSRLKPGMFATVEVAAATESGLVVPADAIVDSGSRQVAFIAQGNGYFEPRAVKAGPTSDGQTLILEGLRDGEEVATRATFFLDSESQMRSALEDYQGAASAGTAKTAVAARIAFAVTPDPPRSGENVIEVALSDANGQPISDADVRVRLSMPAMPSMNMPAMRVDAPLTHAGTGKYRGTASISMAGRWDGTIVARREGRVIATSEKTLLVR